MAGERLRGRTMLWAGWCWLCYRIWLLIPTRYVLGRFSAWLIQYAGWWAFYEPGQPICDDPDCACRAINTKTRRGSDQ